MERARKQGGSTSFPETSEGLVERSVARLNKRARLKPVERRVARLNERARLKPSTVRLHYQPEWCSPAPAKEFGGMDGIVVLKVVYDQRERELKKVAMVVVLVIASLSMIPYVWSRMGEGRCYEPTHNTCEMRLL